MSNEPSALPTPRHLFSLRELFCLTTLAGLFLALIVSPTWTNHERWLLGLTVGGSLLGIAIARAFQRRGWLVGILAGSIGGLIAVGIIGLDWLSELNRLAGEGIWMASQLDEFRNASLAAVAVTLALTVLLALLGVPAYLLLVWATDAGEQGLFSATRRHPYRASAVAMVVITLFLAIANIDFLLDPQAWAPRHFISLTSLERQGATTVRTGSLSRSGDWLLVESFMPSIGREVADKELYRLDPRPHVVSFTDRPDRASFVAFDCTENRLLFLEWLGEFYYDRPAETHRLRIVDLDRHTSETLTEKPLSADIHSLQWLPDGSVVIHYGDEVNGKKGHTKLQPLKEPGQWSRQESDVVTEFDPRSGTALEFSTDGLRLVDLKSSREIASFPQEWVDEMTKGLGGDPGQYLKLSPDGRFLLAGSKIYDRESRAFRDWQPAGMIPQQFFHVFTSGGQAVYIDESNSIAWHPYYFLTPVPFVSRVLDWLKRDPIRLLDPATGLEVARTRPLRDWPNSITLSPDGSRMAVFTNDGVYVYDVPVKFR